MVSVSAFQAVDPVSISSLCTILLSSVIFFASVVRFIIVLHFYDFKSFTLLVLHQENLCHGFVRT